MKPIKKHNTMETKKLPMYEVLFSLMAGERLTVQKAFRLFHTTELRKIVSRLRRKGYDVRADRKYKETIDGRRVTFNEYYICTTFNPCAES